MGVKEEKGTGWVIYLTRGPSKFRGCSSMYWKKGRCRRSFRNFMLKKEREVGERKERNERLSSPRTLFLQLSCIAMERTRGYLKQGYLPGN